MAIVASLTITRTATGIHWELRGSGSVLRGTVPATHKFARLLRDEDFRIEPGRSWTRAEVEQLRRASRNVDELHMR